MSKDRKTLTSRDRHTIMVGASLLILLLTLCGFSVYLECR
jgi:hypothetical protein